MHTADLEDDMQLWRRDFHAHPELGFKEHRTSGKVADLLESFGLEVHRGVGGTGVVGILKRGNGNRSIGIRADMDALPITESNDLPHKSQNKGVMHACGHDGHTAMLLGAARHLSENGSFNGRVVFVFQPNEEHGLGAAAMIADGLFENFDVDSIYAMHNMPGLPLGQFATRSGPMTASESLFEITITARGGHAALPHMGVDAITVGSELVGALQTIVSRKLDPGRNGVVSVTEFVSDGGRNILPGRAVLRGDARALSPEITAEIEARMRQIAAGICSAHGVSAEVDFQTIFPATINAPDATRAAAGAAEALVGSAHIDRNCQAKLFSEDFAHMAKARSGCFVLMGNGTEGRHARPLHSADYEFSDKALVTGSSYWVQLVEQELGK